MTKIDSQKQNLKKYRNCFSSFKSKPVKLKAILKSQNLNQKFFENRC